MKNIKLLFVLLVFSMMSAVIALPEVIQVTGTAYTSGGAVGFLITGGDLTLNFGGPGGANYYPNWTDSGVESGTGGLAPVDCFQGCGSWNGINANVVEGGVEAIVERGQPTVPPSLTFGPGIREGSDQSLTDAANVSGSFAAYDLDVPLPGDCTFSDIVTQECGPELFTVTLTGTGTVSAYGLAYCQQPNSGCSSADGNVVFLPSMLGYTFSGTADVEPVSPPVPEPALGWGVGIAAALLVACRKKLTTLERAG